MKTEKITLKEDITIEKGTIIPRLHPSDERIGFDFHLKKGAILQRGDYGHSVTESRGDGSFLSIIPYHPIFNYAWEKSIEQGHEVSTETDELKRFKVFSLITENRIVPEEGNYLTEFCTKTIEEAQKKAKKYCEGLDLNFIVKE